tara:strand:+ start:1158 stop:1616 length:459 start_codon:yes stop_codon:yes gene_type:complete
MPLLGVDKVKKAMQETKVRMNENIRGVSLYGLGKMIEETPADKGIHRNNWFLSVGFPATLFGRDGNGSGNGSYRSLQSMPKWILNKKIYFVNNGPAITTLEYGGFPSPVENGSYIKKSKSFQILSINGYSKQAPNGWVRARLIKMQNKVRSL